MKLQILIIILCCSVNIVAYSQVTYKVLFLGNSYTSKNNLPQIISDIALNMGDTLIYDSYTPGGYKLQQHRIDSISINKIQNGGWDFVILQDQSQVPAFPWYNGVDAAHLSYLINQYNPCAHSMFYMTWGRKNGDISNCSSIPPMCTYLGMDSLLSISYMNMAASNSGEVSPVGAVWNYIRHNYPGIELYQSDESHPSPEGSYAAACCFYVALFKKNPTNITFNYNINPSIADNIKNAVRTVVFDSLSKWDFVKHIPPIADFNYNIGNGMNQVTLLNNSSSDADFYLWDFGDGFTSTNRYPLPHSYASDGSYTITLTVTYCDLFVTYKSQYQKSINFCSFSPTISPDNLSICPNTSDTLWTQIYDSYQWLDSNGDSIPNQNNQYFLASGNESYSVIVKDNGCTEISPQVYVHELGVRESDFYNCNTVGVSKQEEKSLISVYPNPSSGIINVKVEAPYIGLNYTITDIFGQLVCTGNLNESINYIYLNEFARGVYFLHIDQSNTSAIKVIKN